ncbi:MAG: SDR family NAD(P)-dependent oxidoreductase [Micromonosporaceae bacterium]
MDQPPVALVTGAGRGVGRAVAIRLAEEGYRVALVSRTERELRDTAAACKGETMVLPADVTAVSAADDLFRQVENAWGTVDSLILNAGRNATAKLPDISDEMWQEMLELNLTAPFRFLRRAVPPMVQQKFGRIVVIASISAKTGYPYQTAYAAAKSGLVGAVRCAAVELARTGVTVNAVCPAYVDTPLTVRTIDTIVERAGWTRERAVAYVNEHQPIGRMVTADEVAESVWSCVANAAITGQALNVDGGLVHH